MLAVGLVAALLLWGFQDAQTVKALGRNLGVARWILIALATAVAALPPVARALAAAFSVLATPTPQRRRAIAVAVAVISTLYLILTAHLQARDLFAKTHDDQSYLIQMQMLAQFKLWMPQHPLADFFDTFYVITRPVYASLYFPGAAMLYVPTIWLGLPTWLMPACVAGACVGLLYRIVAELVDGTSALLAALALVSLEYFRVYSVLLTSHEPMLLMGLLMTWAWLKWRTADRQWRWALAIGLFSGWAAVTRPADAVCFALPIGLAIVLDVFRPAAGDRAQASVAAHPRRTAGRMAATIALIVAGAAPFLALQAWFNKGVTGDWLETPYTYYLRHDQPNTSFGFHSYDPSVRPTSTNPKKQDYYDQFFAPYILRHQPVENLTWWGRVYLPMAVNTALPTRLALPLLAVGLLTIGVHRRWVVAAVLPLFLVLYYFNTFFLEHYALLVAPAMLLLTVLGIQRIAEAWPKRSASIRTALSAGLWTCCLLILPEFNPLWPERHQTGDETMDSPLMNVVEHALPEEVEKPAVVLFTYGFGYSLIEEPVYNTETAWPDDAEVIHAHDLGERNHEIFAYFASRQPNRHFYSFDPYRTPSLTYLGRADELAARKPVTGDGD